MSDKILKIGMPACFFHADPERAIFKGKTLMYMEQSMAHWVMSEGAIPVLLPLASGKIKAKDLVKEIDGLLLQGGSDLSPKSYGEEPLKPEWAGDAIRDEMEIEYVKHCLDYNKPILGVCRGLQLINVARGGTLYQDTETQKKGSLNHRDWNVYDQLFHDIEIKKDSGLSQLYSNTLQGRVNSVHHQSIKELGKGLHVEALCPTDGVIEAVRLQCEDYPDRYCFSVQWHPEFQFTQNSDNQDPQGKSLLDYAPIMNEFISEIRKRKS